MFQKNVVEVDQKVVKIKRKNKREKVYNIAENFFSYILLEDVAVKKGLKQYV